MNYQIYMTDCMKSIIEIALRFGGSKDSVPRFYDIVNPQKKKIQPEKSAEGIIEEVTRKAGLTAI